MKVVSLIVILSLFLVSCVAPAPAPAAEEQMTIGVMAPLTGDAASYGLSILKGAQLAVEDMGGNVKIVAEDSRCDPKEAVSAINKLISVDQVSAIIGEVCSGATLAAAPIAEANGVVMVSASSTSPEISKEDYVYRTVPSDALQGKFGAELVADLGYDKLAVLYGNEEYGVGFNSVLVNIFPRVGGEVVASEAFERGTSDLRAQLTKIKASDAQAIYIISNSPDSAVAALKQIKELDLNVAVFGSEGLKSDDILAGAGDAAEGLILTTVSGGKESFIQAHQERYGDLPGPFAAQGYDAYKAVSLAIETGASTSEEIRTALGRISFEGASGTIDFNSKGDVEGNYDVFVVRGGKFVVS